MQKSKVRQTDGRTEQLTDQLNDQSTDQPTDTVHCSGLKSVCMRLIMAFEFRIENNNNNNNNNNYIDSA